MLSLHSATVLDTFLGLVFELTRNAEALHTRHLLLSSKFELAAFQGPIQAFLKTWVILVPSGDRSD